MLEVIFGNKTAAMIMLYLYHYDEAYATGISKDMNITLSQVQKQLDKFENANLLISKKMGNTRVYRFNPKLGVVNKVKDLVGSFYDKITLDEKQRIFHQRRRPRRKGKPVIKSTENEN